ncbi:hypothetical protein FRB93_006400 [Tulasnella sp. JGI-2019a]|nr:hypothetical protein FRB93_006400 [Tulasnella sp. JGI-2019a]
MSSLQHWLLLASTALSVSAAPGQLVAANLGAALPNTGYATQLPPPSKISTAAETSIPMPVLPSINSVPQAPPPPQQFWCTSDIHCAGPILQSINLARLYRDSKTFVDKPTVKSKAATVADYYGLGQPPTVGNLTNYVQVDIQGEGLELQPVHLPSTETPAFLQNPATIPNPIVRGWASIVNGLWGKLVRSTKQSMLCPATGDGCESSLIPLKHNLVVPGGRFREQYYWDSFWIMEGLLESELYDIAKSSLLNFMDEIEKYGFIPNGGRIYYLNRSQPPIFIKMLSRYVNATSDISILPKALPLAEAELAWWQTNRTIIVVSPYPKGPTPYPITRQSTLPHVLNPTWKTIIL